MALYYRSEGKLPSLYADSILVVESRLSLLNIVMFVGSTLRILRRRESKLLWREFQALTALMELTFTLSRSLIEFSSRSHSS